MAAPGAGAYHLHVSGFGSALVAETALVRHRAFADVAGAAPEFAPMSLSCSNEPWGMQFRLARRN
jgi:hypothetical protein